MLQDVLQNIDVFPSKSGFPISRDDYVIKLLMYLNFIIQTAEWIIQYVRTTGLGYPLFIRKLYACLPQIFKYLSWWRAKVKPIE